jgi:hypothetical protein
VNDLQMNTLAFVGAGFIRALALTWRVRWRGMEHLDAARAHHPAVIFCFWHGRLLPLCWVHRNRNAQVLASEHEDGEMLGRAIRHFGFGHVRGSSTRGGARALRELARCVRAGYDLGLTVDGPRGPRYVAKPGAIEVARMTGAAVLPITTASRRHYTFSSWDAFELPLPLTSVTVAHGAPVMVPRDADATLVEAKRKQLDATLRAITEEADADISRS